MKSSRNTRQKELLLQEVKKFDTFFNAEELYVKLSKIEPTIGIATVYRFLKQLVEKDQIHSYSCGGKMTYSNNQNNHCHFKCSKCGEIKHLNLKNINFLLSELKAEVCHFQIDVCGICEKCKS
mgnify:CR=1 FL=1